MNKSQLVEAVSAKTKVASGDVAKVVDALTATVAQTVARGDKVVLSGFGTFHRKARARRTGRNIWTDQPVAIPSTNVPAFSPGKPFREQVAKRRRSRAKTPAAPSRRK